MHRRAGAVVLWMGLVGVVAVVIGSPSGAAPAPSATPGSSAPVAARATSLTWKRCDGNLQCATLKVPVAHAKPNGPTLTLGLVRRLATDRAHRIGTLLTNPGGPGGTAIGALEARPLPAGVAARFDQVAFDPRGVGRSKALNCHGRANAMLLDDPTIETQADKDAMVRDATAFLKECKAKYGDLMAHLGTDEVVQDMDMVRAALGEDKISYLGYSYGTALGQVYAARYPQHVRAMVLDGVVDLSQNGLESLDYQAGGFERALNAFIKFCDTRGCGIKGPAGKAIDAVMAAAERAPIHSAHASRPARPADVQLGIGEDLYNSQSWGELGAAIQKARQGDGSELVRLTDDYLSPVISNEVYYATSCTDVSWPHSADAVFAQGKATARKYPRLGEAVVSASLPCALWTDAPAVVNPDLARIQGLPPVVVISTTNDPATPYAAGVKVAKAIPKAVLITNVGDRHTIFNHGKPCIDNPVVAYLTTGRPPRAGLRCP